MALSQRCVLIMMHNMLEQLQLPPILIQIQLKAAGPSRACLCPS